MTIFFDTVAINGARLTADGYLVADARVARTGIQEYLGSEVDPDGSLGLRDKQVVRVYRPEDEVFSDEAMRTYAYRPVTNDHPSQAVTSDNWRDLAVGQTGGEVARDGDWIRVPMVLMDAGTIKDVEYGKRQLSMGYTCTLDATPGTTPDGEKYDAVQRGLRMNHLAVVAAARAGATARIGDGKGLAPITKKEDIMSENLKTVVLGDKAVQVAVADVAAIEQFKTDAAKALADAETAHQAAMAAKDAEIAKKDAEIDDLKGKVLDGAALDAAVAARGDLIAKARAIAPDIKTDGLSDAAIRKVVVVAKLGDAMAQKADAYIDARFDMLAEDAEAAGSVASAIASRPQAVGDKAAYDKALADSISNLNAHRKTA